MNNPFLNDALQSAGMTEHEADTYVDQVRNINRQELTRKELIAMCVKLAGQVDEAANLAYGCELDSDQKFDLKQILTEKDAVIERLQGEG